MNKEEIEELAFKDRKELANLNELDLLEIIEFLQNDRKQWINQFSKTHNESIDIQKENKQLKIQISAREEVCNRLESNWNKLKEYLNYKSERAVGEDEYVYDEIYNEMQELDQGSDSNEI